MSFKSSLTDYETQPFEKKEQTNSKEMQRKHRALVPNNKKSIQEEESLQREVKFRLPL